MTRFIHLTDLHISHPDAGDPSDKTGAVATLNRVVGLINAMERQPDFVIVSGDLTNTGHPRSYALLHEMLKPLQAPVVLALGNHDKRAEFHAALGRPLLPRKRAGRVACDHAGHFSGGACGRGDLCGPVHFSRHRVAAPYRPAQACCHASPATHRS